MHKNKGCTTASPGDTIDFDVFESLAGTSGHSPAHAEETAGVIAIETNDDDVTALLLDQVILFFDTHTYPELF